MKTTIYSPDSGIRKPWTLLKSIFSDWIAGYELGVRFFSRNIKGMYRQSILGFAWAVIPPLMTAGVWVFLNGQSIINIEQPVVPYPAFILTSTMLWATFAMAVVAPIQSLKQGKSLIVKLNFPKESLLIATLLNVALNFLIRVGLIVIVFIVFAVVPGTSIWLAPFGIIILIFMGFSLGLIIAPVGMLFNDVERLLNSFLPFWMLLTPVIYPEPRAGIGAVLNKYNPVSPILSTTRHWIFGEETILLTEFWWMTGLAFFLFIIGMIAFKLSMPILAERFGS